MYSGSDSGGGLRLEPLEEIAKDVKPGPVTRVRRSSPRTAKRPRTGLDRTDLGPVLGPGPASVLNGPVFYPYLIGVVTSHD